SWPGPQPRELREPSSRESPSAMGGSNGERQQRRAEHTSGLTGCQDFHAKSGDSEAGGAARPARGGADGRQYRRIRHFRTPAAGVVGYRSAGTPSTTTETSYKGLPALGDWPKSNTY